MQIEETVSLKPYNTFGLEADAQYFVRCQSVEEVQEFFRSKNSDNLPVIILGGGSNILLTGNLEGWVIKMDIRGIEVLSETDKEVLVRVGAGENWHEFVMHALAQDWGGIENLSLIPGTVGAAPMQNIGAYGVEIEQVFDHLRAVNRVSGEIVKFNHSECEFGYRESVFKNREKNKFVICDVTFRLTLSPHKINTSYGAIQQVLDEQDIKSPTIRDVSNAVISIRQSKLPDPREIGNSGSFFKNPTISVSRYRDLQSEFPEIPGYKVDETHIKVPAGWLIEQCGWKGYTRNNIGVHKKQALVLVNYGGGKGNEIYDLAIEIQASVNKRFGIKLHPEVNIL